MLTWDSPSVTARSGAGMRMETLIDCSPRRCALCPASHDAGGRATALLGCLLVFGRFDPHALVLGPGEGATDLLVRTADLQDHPAALVTAHVGATDVRNDLKLF